MPSGSPWSRSASLVDAPKGLDEGEAALAYEGAEASLLGGFWVQIVAGAVLIACGLLLPLYLRPARARDGHRAQPPRRDRGPRKAAAARAPRPRLRAERGPRAGSPAKRKVQGAGT